METIQLQLSVLPFELAICRLAPDSDIPDWATKGVFFSITRSPDELSVVCEARLVPHEILAESPFRAFKVQGPLDFSISGIIASLTGPLAAEQISVFSVSTYDTDYVLIPTDDLSHAAVILARQGHQIGG